MKYIGGIVLVLIFLAVIFACSGLMFDYSLMSCVGTGFHSLFVFPEKENIDDLSKSPGKRMRYWYIPPRTWQKKH